MEVYTGSFMAFNDRPAFILSDSGIELVGEEFFHWNAIQNEHVATVTLSSINRMGNRFSSGSRDVFKFECATRDYALEFRELAIETWQLDLLLYIYRGRFMTGGQPTWHKA